MHIKYKKLEIDVEDLKGMDDDLDTFIDEKVLVNDLFFQDEIEFPDDDELDEIISNNISRIIQYNKKLKTDFDRARAIAINNRESYDINWTELEPRGQIYMFDDDDNDIDIVEATQNISDEFKLEWINYQTATLSVGAILLDFFDNEQAVEAWKEYAINELGMKSGYSPHKDKQNIGKFPNWFLNIYKYDLSNEEMIYRVANENGNDVYEDEIEYNGKKYNFIWFRS